MSNDPFEDILNLEEQFYQEGYKLGLEDGDKAGRSEGRSLGLERGFQKFAEGGKLFGRAIVWANRLPAVKSKHAAGGTSGGTSGGDLERTVIAGEVENVGKKESRSISLPSLPNNPRLEKHITTLYALVEADTLSTENTDEAVNDFDDRIKRAQGRAKIIERMAGEGAASKAKARTASSPTKVVNPGLGDV